MGLGFRAVPAAQVVLRAVMVLLTCVLTRAKVSPPAAPIGMLRVTGTGVFIPLKDLGLRYPVGKRLPLFQETRGYYVVKVTTPEYGERLCAFPVRNRRGEATAWVTEDGLLIFGRPTVSCPGRFYFSRGELLPVVAKGERGYLAEVTRFGRKVQILIPRDRSGLEFLPWTPPSKKEAKKGELVVAEAAAERKGAEPGSRPSATSHYKKPPVRRVGKRTLPAPAGPGEETEAVTGEITGPSEGESAAVGRRPAKEPEPGVVPPTPAQAAAAKRAAAGVQKKPAAVPEAKEYIIEIEIPEELRPLPGHPSGLPETPAEIAPPTRSQSTVTPVLTARVLAATGTISTATGAEVAATSHLAELPGRVETSRPTVVPRPSQPEQRAAGFPIILGLGAVALQIVLVVVVVEAVLIMRLKRQLAVGMGAAAAERVDFVTVGETAPAGFYFQIAEEEGDFSGLLASFSLAELVQFLHNAEDNGVLMLKRVDGSIVGQFFFKSGEVIDAFFEDERGADAFRRAFTEEGNLTSFAFRRKNLSGRRRYIKEPTVNLLMETVKAVDHGDLEGGGAPPDLNTASPG